MARTILALLVLCTGVYAQPLTVGLKLGVPATDAFKVIQTQSPASSQHFTWGPYLEVKLPGGNSVEIDALRRTYDYGAAGSGGNWEFPVVIKHRLTSGTVRPYFEGGAAFSRLSDIGISALQHRTNYGLVVGGGVEFNLLLIKVSPEIRYTGWAMRNFDGSLRSNRNQVAVLMGFNF